MNYHSLIIRPPNYPFSECFVEVARAVDEALNALGAYDPRGIPIVFGAHLEKRLPDKAIIYNTEQKFSWDYLQTLKKHRVWDYSGNNILKLAEAGVKAELCPVAYMPSMTVTLPDTNRLPIDVLMYGCRNERRQHIYEQLNKAGINAYFCSDIWGAKRDAMIARAKIVLNVHFYEEAIFEIFRCAHLMANKKCIVSEIGKDKKLENPCHACVVMSSYDHIVQQCQRVLALPEETREVIRNMGFETFSKTSMVDSLKDLI